MQLTWFWLIFQAKLRWFLVGSGKQVWNDIMVMRNPGSMGLIHLPPHYWLVTIDYTIHRSYGYVMMMMMMMMMILMIPLEKKNNRKKQTTSKLLWSWLRFKTTPLLYFMSRGLLTIDGWLQLHSALIAKLNLHVFLKKYPSSKVQVRACWCAQTHAQTLQNSWFLLQNIPKF